MLPVRLAAVALVVMSHAAHARPAHAGGKKVIESEEGWKAAEQIVRDHYTKTKGWTINEVERTGLPYVLRVAFEGGGGAEAVVYDGKYVDAKGVGALADYLKFIDARRRSPRLRAQEWILLMYVFEAWPEAALSTFMQPYLDIDARNPRFVMAYPVSTPEATNDDRPATRYSLELVPSYKLEWHAAQIVFSRTLFDQSQPR